MPSRCFLFVFKGPWFGGCTLVFADQEEKAWRALAEDKKRPLSEVKYAVVLKAILDLSAAYTKGEQK
jgi:hypothetical protein